MNRKECNEFIKTHNLKDKATNLARSIYGNRPKINWTNLTNKELERFVNSYNKPKTSVKKIVYDETNNKCIDNGARKAILVIAKILNLKNIDRNFN